MLPKLFCISQLIGSIRHISTNQTPICQSRHQPLNMCQYIAQYRLNWMSCVGNLPGCLYLKTQLAVDLDVILNSKGSLFEEKVVQPHNKEHFVLY